MPKGGMGMGKWLVTLLLGSLTVVGCGTVPTATPELSTQRFGGWGVNAGSLVPSSGLEAYLRHEPFSQTGVGGWSPWSWQSYYPGWGGPSPYYLPPVYRTTLGNLTYLSFPATPWPIVF